MELFLVRHGHCAYDSPVFEDDLPLSPKGEQQAVLLAKYVHGLKPTRLFTSPLRRAAATAGAIARETGLEPQACQAFREIWIGDLLGVSNADAMRIYGDMYPGWDEPVLDFGFAGGESASEFANRVVSAFNSYIWEPFRDTREKVVLVAHGGTINVVLCHVLGVPFTGPLIFDIHNASVSRVRTRRGRTYVRSINETHHLSRPSESRKSPPW